MLIKEQVQRITSNAIAAKKAANEMSKERLTFEELEDFWAKKVEPQIKADADNGKYYTFAFGVPEYMVDELVKYGRSSGWRIRKSQLGNLYIDWEPGWWAKVLFFLMRFFP